MLADDTNQVNYDAAISAWRQGLTRVRIELSSGETARKGLVTLADQGVASGTNFLTGVIIGRTLAKEEFGLYMLGFSIVIFLMTLQTSLISSPYTVYSPRLKDTAHFQYTGSSLIHQLAFCTLAILSLALAGVALSFGVGPHGLAPVVWALVVVITFIMLRDYVRRICFASLRMKTAFVLDSCVAVVQICGLLLLSHLGLLSTIHAFWILGLACGLPALGWLIWSRRKFILSIHHALSDLRRNWLLAKWIFAASVASIVSSELYLWFLAGFHGTAVTGVLSACRGAFFLTNPLLMGMANLLGPKTAHAVSCGGRAELDRIVVRSTLAILVPISVICLALIFLGGWLVALMYGPKYVGYGWIVSILALIPLIASLSLPTNCALLAIERPDAIFKSYLASGAVTLLLGIPLVSTYGVGGAAVAMLCSATVGTSFRIWSFWVRPRSSNEYERFDVDFSSDERAKG